ncbi:MAG: hypothetical protein IPL14_19320 [Nitrospira sp.]|nr:hypothetical protein [Nitrospira sp.]
MPGLLKAFHDVAAHTTPLDVIVMSRGGGNEIDLVAFDNLDVARAVATASKPVLTGLGHHLDRSICDEVAAKALSTPTAAGQYPAIWTASANASSRPMQRYMPILDTRCWGGPGGGGGGGRGALRDRLEASYQQGRTLRYSLTASLTQALSQLSRAFSSIFTSKSKHPTAHVL